MRMKDRAGRETMNAIRTWAQGFFVHSKQNQHLSEEQKQAHDAHEKCNVRPGPTENAICRTTDPHHAAWIAQRLNLASRLEQLTYDFATGKSDGSEIKDYVRTTINR